MGGSTRAIRGARPSCQVTRTGPSPVTSITCMGCLIIPRTTAREKSAQRLPKDEGEAMALNEEDGERSNDGNRGNGHGHADRL